MSRKWPGSLITKTKVTPTGPLESGTASGVWTLAEALQWTGKELWPIAGNTPPEIIFNNCRCQRSSSFNNFDSERFHNRRCRGLG